MPSRARLAFAILVTTLGVAWEVAWWVSLPGCTPTSALIVPFIVLTVAGTLEVEPLFSRVAARWLLLTAVAALLTLGAGLWAEADPVILVSLLIAAGGLNCAALSISCGVPLAAPHLSHDVLMKRSIALTGVIMTALIVALTARGLTSSWRAMAMGAAAGAWLAAGVTVRIFRLRRSREECPPSTSPADR